MIEVESLPGSYTYGAAKVLEIIQNVRHILSTRKGTVPLHREFGLDFSLLDTPMPGIRAKAESEIFLALKKWEPRCVLKQILWDANAINGEVRPKVVIDIVKGVL